MSLDSKKIDMSLLLTRTAYTGKLVGRAQLRIARSSFLIPLLLLMVLVFAFPSSADACPTCKDTLGLHALRVQAGYALSIGFMMLVPFAIICAWAVAIFRMVKAQKIELPQPKDSKLLDTNSN